MTLAVVRRPWSVVSGFKLKGDGDLQSNVSLLGARVSLPASVRQHAQVVLMLLNDE